jgi:hypothetical protein
VDCLLQGNYLYKFLQDYETEGTKRERVDNTIRDMAKDRKGPCQRDWAWLGRGMVLRGHRNWEWSMGNGPRKEPRAIEITGIVGKCGKCGEL